MSHKGSDAFCHYLECCVALGWSASIFACKSPEFCRFLLLIMMLLLFVFSSHCFLPYIVLVSAFVSLTKGRGGKGAACGFHFSGSCN